MLRLSAAEYTVLLHPPRGREAACLAAALVEGLVSGALAVRPDGLLGLGPGPDGEVAGTVAVLRDEAARLGEAAGTGAVPVRDVVAAVRARHGRFDRTVVEPLLVSRGLLVVTPGRFLPARRELTPAGEEERGVATGRVELARRAARGASAPAEVAAALGVVGVLACADPELRRLLAEARAGAAPDGTPPWPSVGDLDAVDAGVSEGGGGGHGGADGDGGGGGD